jgi:hypothetical protein
MGFISQEIWAPIHGLGMNFFYWFFLFPYFVTLAFVCDSIPFCLSSLVICD